MLVLHLKTVGFTLLLLGVLHFAFPRRFRWTEELQRLSLLNRQIFLVHCFFIVLTVWLMGSLALFFTDALLEPTSLARLVLAGLVIFWGARLVCQLAVYDARLWRGNRFNTGVHVAFSALWTYYIAVFSWALWRVS
jgi:hypothetical protein